MFDTLLSSENGHERFDCHKSFVFFTGQIGIIHHSHDRMFVVQANDVIDFIW